MAIENIYNSVNFIHDNILCVVAESYCCCLIHEATKVWQEEECQTLAAGFTRNVHEASAASGIKETMRGMNHNLVFATRVETTWQRGFAMF